jgi:hypothetical protein
MPRPHIFNRDDEFHIDLRGLSPRQVSPSRNTLGHLLMRGAGVHVPAPTKGIPGAITKVKYMPAGRTAGYAAYMQKDRAEAAQHVAEYMQSHGGPEGKAELFTRAGESVDLERFIAQSRRDPRAWTIILAPEHGNRLDMQAFTQRFMEQVEADTGLTLDWVAATHHNTPHHHAHVLIRGHDQDGEAFRLAKDYIRTGMRARAMELQARWLDLGLTRAPQQAQQPSHELTTLQRLERWVTSHAREASRGQGMEY